MPSNRPAKIAPTLPEEALEKIGQILGKSGFTPKQRETFLDASRKDPAGVLAVLKTSYRRGRPNLPYTLVEAWKAVAHPPQDPSP